MGKKKQLNDLEPDGPITLSILDGIVWDFTQREMLDVMEEERVKSIFCQFLKL